MVEVGHTPGTLIERSAKLRFIRLAEVSRGLMLNDPAKLPLIAPTSIDAHISLTEISSVIDLEVIEGRVRADIDAHWNTCGGFCREKSATEVPQAQKNGSNRRM